MLSFTHTILSLPLADLFHNPAAIFLAAFLLHLAADAILHWNVDPTRRPYPYKFVALDVLSGLALALPIAAGRWPVLSTLAAIAGGNAPDAIHSLWYIFKPTKYSKYIHWLEPFLSFHKKIQRETTSVPLGLASQIILIALALSLVL